jgi:biopolymer transport protein ExbD
LVCKLIICSDSVMEPESKKPAWARPHINVTPMIDVLLVLLIIFMVIAPTKPAMFEVKVPAKPDPTIPMGPPPDLLMVDVRFGRGQSQTVELNSRSMQLPELATILRDLLDERPNKTVYIRAPRETPYGDIVAVMDTVKAAGASPIGLQIDFLL